MLHGNRPASAPPLAIGAFTSLKTNCMPIKSNLRNFEVTLQSPFGFMNLNFRRGNDLLCGIPVRF